MARSASKKSGGSNREFYGEELKTESSWAGPARIAFITLVLAGGFLYYYFGPRVEDIQGTNPRASVAVRPVNVTIGIDTFTIPENYTVFQKARRGGVQESVELYAALPDFEGYTLPRQIDFEGNNPNSPVVHFSLYDPDKKAAASGHTLDEKLTEREKFERIYLPHVTNPKGNGTRYGFMQYTLSDSWHGQAKDLFVREQPDGTVIMFNCIERSATMPSPWCIRDQLLSKTLGLTYRFKRDRLDSWRAIDRGVMALVERFRTTQAAPPSSPPTAPAAPKAAPQG